MLGHLFDAAVVARNGWDQRSRLPGFQRRVLADSFCGGRDAPVSRHEVGPADAAISFIVLRPVVLPSVIDISGDRIARIFATNRAGHRNVSGFTRNLPAIWPALLFPLQMGRAGHDLLTLIPVGSKFDLAFEPELLRDPLVACDAVVACDPAPLGKVADVIQRRFLRARTRQAACQLLVGQFITLDDTPCIALGLCAVRKRDRRGAFMLEENPVSDFWRGLSYGCLLYTSPSPRDS